MQRIAKRGELERIGDTTTPPTNVHKHAGITFNNRQTHSHSYLITESNY